MMGWETISETAAASVGASGLVEWSAGDSLSADDLNNNLADVQGVTLWGMPSGVLAGGACTAAFLVVTVPDGTRYLARNIWCANGNQTISVTDESTTYVWGCADGVLRITSSSTPPVGWDDRTACILCRAVATGGTATVDLSVQQRARLAIGHQVFEGSGIWAPTPDVIGANGIAHVPDANQISLFDALTVLGELTVYGMCRVV